MNKVAHYENDVLQQLTYIYFMYALYVYFK